MIQNHPQNHPTDGLTADPSTGGKVCRSQSEKGKGAGPAGGMAYGTRAENNSAADPTGGRTCGTPIWDFVSRYADADVLRLHMPGHKGHGLLGCERYDITEICGADALYEASGIIAESEANAASLFGSGRTLYATEGSSQCIRAMVYLAVTCRQEYASNKKDPGLSVSKPENTYPAGNRASGIGPGYTRAVTASPVEAKCIDAASPARAENTYPAGVAAPDGRPVLVAARNAHRSFLHACALADADVVWLWPEDLVPSDVSCSPGDACSFSCPSEEDPGISCPSEGASSIWYRRSLMSCPVSPAQLERTLSSLNGPCCGVYLTSPDYTGYCQDIDALSEVCHRHGVPLLVDNAHGAYLHFLPEPCHPLDLGADLCCDSAHKTLPVLTGGAYLHISVRACSVFARRAKSAMALFGSTSPSYLTLSSLDLCNAYLAEKIRSDLAAVLPVLADARMQLEMALSVLTADRTRPAPLEISRRSGDPQCLSAARHFSPLHLTIPGDGSALAAVLQNAGIEPEYAGPDALILLFSPQDPAECISRTADVLQDALTMRPHEQHTHRDKSDSSGAVSAAALDIAPDVAYASVSTSAAVPVGASSAVPDSVSTCVSSAAPDSAPVNTSAAVSSSVSIPAGASSVSADHFVYSQPDDRPCRPEQFMHIREAVFSDCEIIPVEAAAGRIAAMPTTACPPAVPPVMPGERITPEAIRMFLHYGYESVSVVC